MDLDSSLPVSIAGEPLPPGEDLPPVIAAEDAVHLSRPPRGPQEPQDMDLDSENEAESRFFQDQRRQLLSESEELFPASVWGFRTRSEERIDIVRERRDSPGDKPKRRSAGRGDGERKRKSSEHDDKRKTKRRRRKTTET